MASTHGEQQREPLPQVEQSTATSVTSAALPQIAAPTLGAVTPARVLRAAAAVGTDPLGGTQADRSIVETLARRRGAGRALPSAVSAELGGAYGADLSQVRVHADSEADTISRSVQATAFTHGNDVYFRAGAYRPDSSSGKRLLAHELAHVVQQQSGRDQGGGGAGGVTIGRADDPVEREADRMADGALAGLRRQADRRAATAPTPTSTPAALHRTIRRDPERIVGNVENLSELDASLSDMLSTIESINSTKLNWDGVDHGQAYSDGNNQMFGQGNTGGQHMAEAGMAVDSVNVLSGFKGLAESAHKTRTAQDSVEKNFYGSETEKATYKTASGIMSLGNNANSTAHPTDALPGVDFANSLSQAALETKAAIEDATAAARLHKQKGKAKHELDNNLPMSVRVQRFDEFLAVYHPTDAVKKATAKKAAAESTLAEKEAALGKAEARLKLYTDRSKAGETLRDATTARDTAKTAATTAETAHSGKLAAVNTAKSTMQSSKSARDTAKKKVDKNRIQTLQDLGTAQGVYDTAKTDLTTAEGEAKTAKTSWQRAQDEASAKEKARAKAEALHTKAGQTLTEAQTKGGTAATEALARQEVTDAKRARDDAKTARDDAKTALTTALRAAESIGATKSKDLARYPGVLALYLKEFDAGRRPPTRGNQPTARESQDAASMSDPAVKEDFLRYLQQQRETDFGFGTKHRQQVEESYKSERTGDGKGNWTWGGAGKTAQDLQQQEDYGTVRGLQKVATFGHRRKAETATLHSVGAAGNALDAAGTLTGAADGGATKATGKVIKGLKAGYETVKKLGKRASRVHKLRTMKNQMGYGDAVGEHKDRGFLWGLKTFFAGDLDSQMGKAHAALVEHQGGVATTNTKKAMGKFDATSQSHSAMTPEEAQRALRKLKLQADRRADDLIAGLKSQNANVRHRAKQLVHVIAETNLAGAINKISDADLEEIKELGKNPPTIAQQDQDRLTKRCGVIREMFKKQLEGVGG